MSHYYDLDAILAEEEARASPRGGRGSRPALRQQADMRVPWPAALLRFRLSARLPRSG